MGSMGSITGPPTSFILVCELVSVLWKRVDKGQFPVILFHTVAYIKLYNFLRAFFCFPFFSVFCLPLVHFFFLMLWFQAKESGSTEKKSNFAEMWISIHFFLLQPYQTPVSPNMRLRGAILILDIPELEGWLVLVPQHEEFQTGLGAAKTTLKFSTIRCRHRAQLNFPGSLSLADFKLFRGEDIHFISLWIFGELIMECIVIVVLVTQSCRYSQMRQIMSNLIWKYSWLNRSIFFLFTQSCLTLQSHGLYSPPGLSVHRISQVRILEWVAISFSRVSS